MNITVAKLSKTVKTATSQIEILRDINFNIPTGKTAAIVGRSGSGKSTLLGLMAGFDDVSSGDIRIDNVVVSQISEDERAQLRLNSLGFVFQSFQLIPTMTAIENVMLPLQIRGDMNVKQTALNALEKVGLAHRVGHRPNQLSGGEQQRVAIARAFVTGPKILFADEPTGNLDINTGQLIIELLFSLNQQYSMTLVLVTHDPKLAEQCEIIIHLENGMIKNDVIKV